MLFEVAIIETPTKDELEKGTGTERLVFGPKAVLAKDAQSAGIKAVMGDDRPTNINLDRVQVLIRPFA